jgi:hypothetical protein
MIGIARRLDHDAREVRAGAEHGRAGRAHAGEHGGEEVLRMGHGAHLALRVMEFGWGVKRMAAMPFARTSE